MLAFELATVIVLIVINGLLAMSELAIVSSRPARLAILVEKKSPAHAVPWRSPPIPENFSPRFRSASRWWAFCLVRSPEQRSASVSRNGSLISASRPGFADAIGVGVVVYGDHLWIVDHRRTGAEANRLARPGSYCGARCTRDDPLGENLYLRSSGCLISPARRCWLCSANTATPTTRSPKTRSAA